MAGEKEEDTSPRDEVGGLSGIVESDDTTQADAGMTGGSGADEDQASVSPMATEPHSDNEELDGD